MGDVLWIEKWRWVVQHLIKRFISLHYRHSTSSSFRFWMHHRAVVVTQCIVSITFSLGTIAAANGLHTILLHAVLRLPMTFFDVTPLGRILNRFAKDVDVCDNVLPHVLRMFIAMTFGVSFFILLFRSWTKLLLFLIQNMWLLAPWNLIHSKSGMTLVQDCKLMSIND